MTDAKSTRKDPRFLAFVHIEKAGGITVHNMLHRNYLTYLSPSPLRRFGEHFGSDELASLLRVVPFKIQGIGGHKIGSFLGYEAVVPVEIFYFTFMRDPIRRFLSHYNWQTSMMGSTRDFDAFLSDPEFHNFQCYRIAGVRRFAEARTEIDQKFSFVGLVEEYDRSCLELAGLLGHGFSPVYEQANVRTNTRSDLRFDDLSADVLAEIREANSEDIALYDYVSSLCREWQTTPEQVASFVKERDRFRTGPAILAKRKLTNQVLARVVQPYLCRRSTS